jgi:hypothetical protein
MIVYFLKEAGNYFASVLILQPQKGRIKVLKFGAKQDLLTLVKSHIVNDPLNSQLHVFARNSKSEIIHQVFYIKKAAIQAPQS